jgi:nucleoside-diphosphate-sugar epimerase
MTRVLLFGAAGFVGRQVRAVLAPDVDLICPGRVECDLLSTDPVTLTELIRSAAPDAIINGTGALDGTGYDLLRANALVTAKLIEAVAMGAPSARYVRIGSAGEYGAVPFGMAVTETYPAMPASEYGVSHLAGTRLVELAVDAGRVDGVVLRVFNPVGPGVSPENVFGRATELLRSALATRGGRIVLGPLDAYRDFVDVRDVALAVRAAIRASSLPQRVFNIGSGRAVITRDAIRHLAVVAGFAGEIREERNLPARGRSADVSWACADISAAAQALGWTPRHDLVDTLSALWNAAVERDQQPLATRVRQ